MVNQRPATVAAAVRPVSCHSSQSGTADEGRQQQNQCQAAADVKQVSHTISVYIKQKNNVNEKLIPIPQSVVEHPLQSGRAALYSPQV
jgi:hypothetical protein